MSGSSTTHYLPQHEYIDDIYSLLGGLAVCGSYPGDGGTPISRFYPGFHTMVKCGETWGKTEDLPNSGYCGTTCSVICGQNGRAFPSSTGHTFHRDMLASPGYRVYNSSWDPKKRQCFRAWTGQL